MTKTQYLGMRGFDPTDWGVFESDEASPFLEMEQAVNNMFPVKESKAIAAFGKGAYIIKLVWMAKHTEVSSITINPNDSAVEIVTEAPPAAPTVSGMNIPPPPPPVPPKMTAPIIEEAVIVEDDTKSELLKTRIANLLKKGWVDSGLSVDKDGKSIFYKDLEEMENDIYTSLIKPEPIEELIPDNELNTEDRRDLPWEFECDKHAQTGVACEEQCKFCKQQEAKIDPVEQAKKDLEKVVEKSEIQKDNVIITAPKAMMLGADAIASPKKKAEPKKKTTPKKVEPEKPKEKIDNVPEASQEIAGDFQLVDQLVGIMSLFKKQAYALACIEDLLNDDTSTEEERNLGIQNAIDNISHNK